MAASADSCRALPFHLQSASTSTMAEPAAASTSCPHREMAAATLLGVREGVLLFDQNNSSTGADTCTGNTNSTCTGTRTNASTNSARTGTNAFLPSHGSNAGENPNHRATSSKASSASASAEDDLLASDLNNNTRTTMNNNSHATFAITDTRADTAADTDAETNHHRQQQPLNQKQQGDNSSTSTPTPTPTPTSTSVSTQQQQQVHPAHPGQAQAQARAPMTLLQSHPRAHPPHNNHSDDHRFVSMSSIGFGIDPAFDGRDATEACARALNDSMLRSTLRLSTNSSSHGANHGANANANANETSTSHQRLHVKLGVPSGLDVDTHRLQHQVLPPVSALTLEIVTGGLAMIPSASENNNSNSNSAGPSICTVVACMTLQQQDPSTRTIPSATSGTNSSTTNAASINMSTTTANPSDKMEIETTTKAAPVSASSQNEHNPTFAKASPLPTASMTTSTRNDAPMPTSTEETQEHRPRDSSLALSNHQHHPTPTPSTSQHHYSQASKPHRTNSMEVLAMISEKLANASTHHDTTAISMSMGAGAGAGAGTTTGLPSARHFYEYATGPASQALSRTNLTAAIDAHRHSHALIALAQTMHAPTTSSSASSLLLNPNVMSNGKGNGKGNGNISAGASANGNEDDEDFQNDPNSNYNYQKLPPGLTMKNNRRLFVKHSYQDFSQELPLPEELPLAQPGRVPNAAFPLKLHEILTQIEEDQMSHIIGWLPHGRSFRIHQQREFAECILPRYFTITKKSSFLRQLNLYGFNRFSAGPDQGSYYHEKFLRGMKFLTKRMNRQKVNGNRIRSAGNPDDEPVLASYPACPPGQHQEVPV